MYQKILINQKIGASDVHNITKYMGSMTLELNHVHHQITLTNSREK